MAVRVDDSVCTLTISATDNASSVILRAESILQGLADTNNNVVQRMQTQWDSMGGSWRQNMNTLETMNRLAARTAQDIPTAVDRDLLKKMEAEQNTLKLLEDGIGSLGGKSLQGGEKVLSVIGNVKNLLVTGIAEKVKYQEETIKNGRAVANEMMQLEKNRDVSAGLKDAYYELYLAKRELAKDNLGESLKTQDTLLVGMQDKIKFYASESTKLNLFGSADRAREKKEELEELYDLSLKQRRVDQETLKQMQHEKPLTKEQLFGGGGPADTDGVQEKAQQKSFEYMSQISYAKEMNDAELELARAKGASMDEIRALEDNSYAMSWAQKLEGLRQAKAGEEEVNAAYEVMDTQRKAREAAREEQLKQQKLQSMQQSFSNFAQIGQTMASLGGKNARKWFSMQKTASIAEAIMNTYQGATKAYAQGGIWGAVLAASIIALGMAQVAKIRSQTFDGGSSAGGGEAGSIGATPAGLSSTVPERPVTEASQPSQVVNVHVYGNIVDHDAFARELVPAIQKATSDGVR